MTDSQPDVVDNIQYMQTVRDDTDKGVAGSLDHESGVAFSTMIDPPRETKSGKFSFESDDDILLTSDEDQDYHLSTSSSSEDDTFIKGPSISANRHFATSSGVENDVTDSPPTLSKGQTTSATSQTSKLLLPSIDKKDRESQANTFKDVLSQIFEEKPDIPPQSKLGPKPWLMKRNLPKTNKKYEVSNEPFIYKPKLQVEKEKHGMKEPETEQNVEESPMQEDGIELSAEPQFRGRTSSANRGNHASDSEKSVKYASEADTGFGSNTSSNPSPSNSSNNVSRLPSREEKTSPPVVTDTNNAQELARAALQALSLSKNILQDMERGKETSKQPPRDPDSIYDEVPISPMKKNLYDDVPGHRDEVKKITNGKRTVISVPVFKPPPDPVRNDKNHPMSSEPIYDITRSNVGTPQNVSNGALDLMYQLFGKDLTGHNMSHGPHGRPSSVKSVTFEDEMKTKDDGFPSRPSSRAGSVCSEWSDCTLNISEYPESEASTLPRTTIDFPRMPQVGFPTQNLNCAPAIGFPAPQINPPFPGNNPYCQQFQTSNNNFQQNANPMGPPATYSQTLGLYQAPNNIYSPRNPMFPTPQATLSPRNPFSSQNEPGVRSPDHGSCGPYKQYRPMQPRPYFRPPAHAFSPPRHQWGGFSPTHGLHRSHRHHHYEHSQGRGRNYSRGRRGRKLRSHSRSRRREGFYSDEDDFSLSPSPPRNRHRHYHRDVMDPDVIAGKSYIDGYKAALKDAVMTFAEKEEVKRIAAHSKEDKEARMHKTLRRALSAGRIHELPDNVELGDIRKAFAQIPEKSYSDDDYDDAIDDGFMIPSTGRPLSRTGSLRSLPDEEKRRHYRDHRDVDIIRDRREMFSSGSEHSESCDCSECEEEFEMRARFHEGELMTSRPRRNDIIDYKRSQTRADDADCSPRMKGLRQRFVESLEESSGGVRAAARANRDAEFDPRNRRAAERRRNNFEEVRPRQQNGGFRNEDELNYRGPPEQMISPYYQQRARPDDWKRRERHGYY